MRLEAGGRPKQWGRPVLRDARTQRPSCGAGVLYALLRTRAAHRTPLARRRGHSRARRGRVRCRGRDCGSAACSRQFLFTMSNSAVSSFPPRVVAPGFCVPPSLKLRRASQRARHSLGVGGRLSFRPTPNRGAGGAPTGAIFLGRAVGRDRPCLSRRGASRSGGTLASRRSAVAILGPGPRFHLRHFGRIRSASSSQPGRSAWRAGSRTSRGRRLRAAAAGRHSPLGLQDRL
jgi:hypothetical protein